MTGGKTFNEFDSEMKMKLKICNHQVTALKYENSFLKTKMISHTEIIQMIAEYLTINELPLTNQKIETKLTSKDFL